MSCSLNVVSEKALLKKEMRYSELNRNIEKFTEKMNSPSNRSISNRFCNIDAHMDFYGTYVLLNEQVTLQNQDPVLNEAAQRLGVSLRQTEDQLMRDMLASTASFINCVNGTDGRQDRIIAVTKSSLIDLELLAA